MNEFCAYIQNTMTLTRTFDFW